MPSNYVIAMHRAFFIRRAVRGDGRGGERARKRAERRVCCNDDVTADFNHAFQHKGSRASPSASAGAASRCSAPRWKSVILSRSVPEALVKGSALHLHPPGVIYRVRGKMNGRIKRASGGGGMAEGTVMFESTYRPTFTKRV